jgi:hypothetical protein
LERKEWETVRHGERKLKRRVKKKKIGVNRIDKKRESGEIFILTMQQIET